MKKKETVLPSELVKKPIPVIPRSEATWESVGALRKHAGGMFLVSDLGGYAAVASILTSTALSGERIATPVCGLARNDRLF